MSVAKNNVTYYINSAIGLIIMFGFGLLPTFGPMTEYGMNMLGIFIGIIYLWSFVDMAWPSIAAFVAYAIFSGEGIASIVNLGFGSNQLIMVIFCLVIAYAVISHGVFDNFVPWMLSLKFLKGRPWLITIMLILTIFILQLMQTQFATVFLMISIIYKICDVCNLERSSKWCVFMIGAIMVTAVFASFFYPFSGASVFVSSLFMNAYHIEYTYLQFSFFTISAYIIFMVMYLLVMKFLVRVDVSALATLDVAYLAEKRRSMKKSDYILIGILLAWLVMMFLAGSINILPKNAVTDLLATLGTTGVCLVFFIILGLFRVEGKSAVNLSVVGREIPWEVVLILLVAFAVCPNLCTDDTGIPALMMAILNPILVGKSALAFTIILFIACIILTNLANNTVIIFVIFSIFNVYANEVGANALLCCMLLTMFSQTALLLPASSSFGAVLYGQVEYCGRKNLFMVGLTTMILAIILLFIMIPFGGFVFP